MSNNDVRSALFSLRAFPAAEVKSFHREDTLKMSISEFGERRGDLIVWGAFTRGRFLVDTYATLEGFALLMKSRSASGASVLTFGDSKFKVRKFVCGEGGGIIYLSFAFRRRA